MLAQFQFQNIRHDSIMWERLIPFWNSLTIKHKHPDLWIYNVDLNLNKVFSSRIFHKGSYCKYPIFSNKSPGASTFQPSNFEN